MKLLARILITAFALVLVTYVVPGISVSGPYAAVISAIFLGIVNAVVRPILVLLTLPVTILTLGIFVFVINASLFLFVASFVEGFEVAGFWSALLGSVLVSIISGVANKFID